MNLRKYDKPWKIATPASGTNMRSSTMSNFPGNKSSREHSIRYTRISTAAAQALQHFNYSINSLWLRCLSFSIIPRTLEQVLTTSDTKDTIALNVCVSTMQSLAKNSITNTCSRKHIQGSNCSGQHRSTKTEAKNQHSLSWFQMRAAMLSVPCSSSHCRGIVYKCLSRLFTKSG